MEDRESRIGWWISGGAHLALLLWAILGGVFLRPQESTPLRTTQVATISGSEFEKMAAAARGAGPVGQDATAVADLPQPDADDAATPAPSDAATPDTDPAQALANPDRPEDKPDLSDFTPREPVIVASEIPEPTAEQPAIDETAPESPQAAQTPDAESRPQRPVAPALDSPAEALAPQSELALDRSALPKLRPEGLVENRRARLAAQEAERRAVAEAARAEAEAAERAEAEAAAEAEEERLTAEREAAEEARRAAAEAEAEAERQAEAAREAEEAEAERRAAAEAARQEERRAEEARQAEVERRAAAEREAERQAEAERRAEAERQAEAERKAEEERRAAEARRLAEEAAAQAEDERRAAAEREAEERAAAERAAAEAAERQALEDALRAAQEDQAGLDGSDATSSGQATGGDSQWIGGGSDASATQDPLAAALAGAMSGGGGGNASPPPAEATPNQLAPTPITPRPLPDPGEIEEGADAGDLGGLPMGAPLSLQEREGFSLAIGQQWYVGSLSIAAQQTTVSVAFSIGPDRRPIANTVKMIDYRGGSSTDADHAFEAARRAILISGRAGYPLPPGKYGRWRDVIVDFRPDGIGFD